MTEDKVDDKNIDGIVNDIDQNDDNVILECEGDDEGEREHVQQDEDHDDPLRHGVSRQYESQGGLKRTQNLILFDTRQATGARGPKYYTFLMTYNDEHHCRNMTDLQGLEDHMTVQGKLTHIFLTEGKSWLLMMMTKISLISDQ